MENKKYVKCMKNAFNSGKTHYKYVKLKQIFCKREIKCRKLKENVKKMKNHITSGARYAKHCTSKRILKNILHFDSKIFNSHHIWCEH